MAGHLLLNRWRAEQVVPAFVAKVDVDAVSASPLQRLASALQRNASGSEGCAPPRCAAPGMRLHAAFRVEGAGSGHALRPGWVAARSPGLSALHHSRRLLNARANGRPDTPLPRLLPFFPLRQSARRARVQARHRQGWFRRAPGSRRRRAPPTAAHAALSNRDTTSSPATAAVLTADSRKGGAKVAERRAAAASTNRQAPTGGGHPCLRCWRWTRVSVSTSTQGEDTSYSSGKQ